MLNQISRSNRLEFPTRQHTRYTHFSLFVSQFLYSYAGQGLAQAFSLLVGKALLLIAFGSSIVAAQSQSLLPILNELPAATRDAIEDICLPEQFKNGAAAFRLCVISEIDLRQNAGQATLGRLSLDDKYAVQQTCGASPAANNQTGLQAYGECVSREVSQLEAEPAPDLSDLAENEIYALQQSCFTAQSEQGAAAYRQCINTELTKLRQYPPVSMAGLSSVEKNAIQLGCSPSTVKQSAAQYRLCVAEALTVILKDQKRSQQVSNTESTVEATEPTPAKPVIPEPETTSSDIASTDSATPVTNTEQVLTTPETPSDSEVATATATDQPDPEGTLDAEPDDTTKPRVISKPQTQTVQVSTQQSEPDDTLAANTLLENDQTTAGTINSTATDVISAVAPGSATQDPLPSASVDSIAGGKFDIIKALKGLDLAQYKQYLVYALPIIALLLVWRFLSMIFRRRDRNRHFELANHEQSRFDDLEIRPSATDYAVSHEDHEHDPMDKSVDSTPLAPDTSTQQTEQNTVTVRQESAKTDHIPRPVQATTRKTRELPRRIKSEFAQWLHQQSPLLCKQYCTEFLLYWTSYGDGNFRTEMKEYLLETDDPLTDHDLIKKWVLQEDLNACVDALSYLRSNFSSIELEQTLNLMFAVLVKQELTPVQNTFFRFYADVAGIGIDGLSKLYTAGFGVPLPSISRPDDGRWWQRQSETTRPDAQAGDNLEEPSERDSMLARLGLQSGASESDIDDAYRRIANRYHPEKFDELGTKEQELAHRHLNRYTVAYDFLTGVSA